MIEFLMKVIESNIIKLEENIAFYIETYALDLFWALVILVSGLFVSIIIYNAIIYLFKRFKIIQLINKLDIEFNNEVPSKKDKKVVKKEVKKHNEFHELISKKIKIDRVVAKAASYYVFLLFFRWSITRFTSDVETFLDDLLNYLPSLFIGVVIWYFWLRFADFIYDVVYHSMSLTKQKTTSRIVASWSKIIILFFTLMVVLNYTKLVDPSIINTVLTWFIAMLTIAWWLAFWLWWKDIAREILESFKK